MTNKVLIFVIIAMVSIIEVGCTQNTNNNFKQILMNNL